jgi:hypothetical protein
MGAASKVILEGRFLATGSTGLYSPRRLIAEGWNVVRVLSACEWRVASIPCGCGVVTRHTMSTPPNHHFCLEQATQTHHAAKRLYSEGGAIGNPRDSFAIRVRAPLIECPHGLEGSGACGSRRWICRSPSGIHRVRVGLPASTLCHARCPAGCGIAANSLVINTHNRAVAACKREPAKGSNRQGKANSQHKHITSGSSEGNGCAVQNNQLMHTIWPGRCGACLSELVPVCQVGSGQCTEGSARAGTTRAPRLSVRASGTVLRAPSALAGSPPVLRKRESLRRARAPFRDRRAEAKALFTSGVDYL